MKTSNLRDAVAVIAIFLSAPAFAQTAEDYHPMLTDKWMIGVGGYFPDKDFTIKGNANIVDLDTNVQEDLRLSESDTSAALMLRWRFGEKWSVWAQYFSLESDYGAVLEEDVEWQDLVFEEGSFVNAGFDLDVARLMFGRNFYTAPGHEFGLGVGLHWMEIGAFIEGDITTSEGGTEFRRGQVGAEFPMPNIGAWYNYSWSRNWMVQARVDWLHVSIDEYSGGLLNGLVGIDWRPFEHVGFSAYYNAFTLDGDVKKSDWKGSVEYETYGPGVSVTFSW